MQMYSRQRGYKQNSQSKQRKHSKGILTVSAAKYKTQQILNNSASNRFLNNNYQIQTRPTSQSNSHMITFNHQTSINKIKQHINGFNSKPQYQISHNRNIQNNKKLEQQSLLSKKFEQRLQIKVLKQQIQKLKQTIQKVNHQKIIQHQYWSQQMKNKNQSIKILEIKLLDYNQLLNRHNQLQLQIKTLQIENNNLKDQLTEINSFLKAFRNRKQNTSQTTNSDTKSKNSFQHRLDTIEENSDDNSFSRRTFSYGYSHIHLLDQQTTFIIEILKALNIEIQKPKLQIEKLALKKIENINQTVKNYREILEIFELQYEEPNDAHELLLDEIQNFQSDLKTLATQIKLLCHEQQKQARVDANNEGNKITSLENIIENFKLSKKESFRRSMILDQSISLEKK